MDYQARLDFLDTLTNFELRLGQLDRKDFSLERFYDFLALIDHPQDKLTCVQIAGSKGKGSTALLTAEILKEAGYRVGLYTSPHLYDVRERIRILSQVPLDDSGNGFSGCISKEAFIALVDRLRSLAETSFQGHLTYFEFLTAMAFIYFRDQGVDVAVLETGLGGRLDSTNAAHARVCGITLIDLEHTRILGPTLTQIAAEKAGIIKKGCRRVVCGLQPPEAEEVIRERCRACGTDLILVGQEMHLEEGPYEMERLNFHVRSFKNTYECRMRMLGKFQAVNAAVAIGLAEGLDQEGYVVSKEAVEAAVAGAFWPGRLEIVCREPLVVVDGAHTAEAGRWAAESVRCHFPGRKAVLILGVSSDKDPCGVARHFSDMVRTVILTRSSHARAGDPGLQAEEFFLKQGIAVVRTHSAAEAVAEARRRRSGNDVILVTGSLFLAAEARQMFARG